LSDYVTTLGSKHHRTLLASSEEEPFSPFRRRELPFRRREFHSFSQEEHFTRFHTPYHT
jgi:hypothetical protein